jgi:HTH domain
MSAGVLSRDEAEALVVAIRGSIGDALASTDELFDGLGWIELGLDSWPALLAELGVVEHFRAPSKARRRAVLALLVELKPYATQEELADELGVARQRVVEDLAALGESAGSGILTQLTPRGAALAPIVKAHPGASKRAIAKLAAEAGVVDPKTSEPFTPDVAFAVAKKELGYKPAPAPAGRGRRAPLRPKVELDEETKAAIEADNARPDWEREASIEDLLAAASAIRRLKSRNARHKIAIAIEEAEAGGDRRFVELVFREIDEIAAYAPTLARLHDDAFREEAATGLTAAGRDDLGSLAAPAPKLRAVR